MIILNIFDFRDAGHWIQLLLHCIPLFISIPVIAEHYKWKRETKHTQANALEQNSKLTFTSLQLLLFISIYLSIDTFFSLHSIDTKSQVTENNTREILNKIALNENSKDKIVKGIDAVYKEIADAFESRKNETTFFTVDIIAYTSFTIEPRLEVWKSSGYLHDMTLNIFYMDKDFIKYSPDIDSEWANKVIINTELINNFIDENKNLFKEKNVKINLHAYRHIPGIHGVRLRNEKTVIAFSKWNLENRHIKMPNDEEWFVINKDEISNRGNLLNSLFDNWVTALLKQKL